MADAATVPFEVKNRWTGEVQFTAQITCAPDATPAVKLGLAVRWAAKEKANLRGANLRGANLSEADLSGANLRGANNLDQMIMPDGLTFAEYKRDVVPALLTAGGKTMDDLKAAGAWDCHDWSNCPMHVAFGVNSTSEMVGPMAIYRPRADEFIQFFDARLIPAPWEAEEPTPATEGGQS